ncbi:B3/B4 domain-containing protein [Companilactobacillus metriopterae]|uniref:B3/B4 domain-containing protein n=1 Tax=Companilactobacillus metriopterae TaxID=1909267 RepID=UPI00100AAD61|nr:phenylalanine--tRNA ligase beta subunit-related protein [Companilactobacillus metriopterae]
MKNIVIDQEVIDLFPEIQLSVLTLNNIDNKVDEKDDPYFQKLLDDGSTEAKKFITEEDFKENEVVDQWREAFRKFKTKKGARSSIEALLKRVNQEKSFSPISPLVDIYNSVSLSFGVPCGGEDLDKVQGDLHLGVAKGGEDFYPLGAEESSPALEGEVIYYDKAGAICRCFNWREAKRTMLTEDTHNAVLVVESINNEQAERSAEAIEKLKSLSSKYFDVEGDKYTLNKQNSSEEIY